MIESDIFNIEAAEHHGQPPHGASTPDAHPAGIAAPHPSEFAHGTDEDIHHETQTESTERNGGNNEE